jgi:hypothetical protein
MRPVSKDIIRRIPGKLEDSKDKCRHIFAKLEEGMTRVVAYLM